MGFYHFLGYIGDKLAPRRMADYDENSMHKENS